MSNHNSEDNYQQEKNQENLSLSYTIGIPAILVDDKNLSDRQFRLMIHLIGLARKEGYCYASDKYLAEKMGISLSQIKREIRELEKNEYITRNTDRSKMIPSRSIYVTPAFSKKPYEGSPMSLSKGHPRPYRRATGELHNILSSNNIIKKKERERKKVVATAPPSPLISFGEFKKIKLTQRDYDSLQKSIGKEELDKTIRDADEWLAASGKTKKNYKAFLQSWIRREKEFNSSNHQCVKLNILEKNKTYAHNVEKILRKNGIPKEVKLHANSSYLEIGLKNHPTTTIIEFKEKNFQERLRNELQKMELMQYLDKET